MIRAAAAVTWFASGGRLDAGQAECAGEVPYSAGIPPVGYSVAVAGLVPVMVSERGGVT